MNDNPDGQMGDLVQSGQYAATWALKHPEAVEKLVLIGMPLNAEVRHISTACQKFLP